MKLVDADLFLENVKNELNCEGKCCECEYNNLCEIYKMVEKQHTAYDVDKVVERLESVSIPENKVLYESSDEFGQFVKLKDAVEIVKSGGIE